MIAMYYILHSVDPCALRNVSEDHRNNNGAFKGYSWIYYLHELKLNIYGVIPRERAGTDERE
jgi:hypothetical protein